MIYQYDAFLSYSSADKDWASRLETDLASRGLKVFRDKPRLIAGDPWDDQLQTAIAESRHLVLLWSKQADASDWVEQERIYFEADRKNAGAKRRLIAVNLESANKSLNRYEQITDIQSGNLYAQGAQSLDQNSGIWLRVLNRLEEALKEDDSIPVYKLLMISTLDRLNSIDLNYKPLAAPRFGDTLRELGLKTDTNDYKSELAKFYAVERSDWKPFGLADTVDAVLENLRSRLALSGVPPFRWRDAGEEFWSDEIEDFERAISNISQQFAVIIVDPLSLYDDEVRNRLATLRGSLKPELSATAVLAPFSMPPKSGHVLKVLRGAALDLFRQYAAPLSGGRLYPLILCAHDELDVHRVLYSSLDQRLWPTAKQPTPFTGHATNR